jgi:hypothetical protein
MTPKVLDNLFYFEHTHRKAREEVTDRGLPAKHASVEAGGEVSDHRHMSTKRRQYARSSLSIAASTFRQVGTPAHVRKFMAT